MERHMHRMTELFMQLGLPATPLDIQSFIETNSKIPSHLPLHEAPFWSAAQSDFLRENISSDADWAIVIDALSAAMR